MKKVIISIGLAVALMAGAGLIKEGSSKTLALRQMPAGSVVSYYESIKEAKKCVVNISTQKVVRSGHSGNPFYDDPVFREFFGNGMVAPRERLERSLGSGVNITSNGYIVTNNHVIDGADKIVISFGDDKREYEAKLIGADPKTDLAVVKIEAENLPAIAFANSNTLHEGDLVFAIGNPFGVGETITHGIISALNKSGLGINDYENFIQTDAPINPGNSGGALVDSRGGLIGINSAILSKTGGNHGIGFAIPSATVKRVAEALIQKGRVERGFLGVGLGDLTKDLQEYYGRNDGAVVVEVQPNSSAQKAGLLRGDLITAINGFAVGDSNDLRNRIGDLVPGSKITLEVIRKGQKVTLSTILQKISEPSSEIGSYAKVLDGLTVSPLSATTRRKYHLPEETKGLVVEDVKEGSKADRAGFQNGDLLFQVEDIEIGSLEEFEKAIKSSSGPKRLFIRRANRILILVLK